MSVTLDGQTLDSFGLILQPGNQNPLISESRDRTVQIPGMNGLYDFGTELSEKNFTLPLTWAQETSDRSLQQKVRKFASFLTDGKGKPREIKLVFDYDPDKYYFVKFHSSAPIERLISLAFFSLPFVAYDPIARMTQNVTDITLDSDMMLEYDVQLEDKFSFQITSPTTVSVNDFGTVSVMPTINITGSFNSLSISANGKTLVYSDTQASGTLTIENEKYKAYYGLVNKNNKVSGDWIELLIGYNDVSISGTNLNVTVDFVFEPRFV